MTDSFNKQEMDDFLSSLNRELSSLNSTDRLLGNLEQDMKQSISQIKTSDEKSRRKMAATINDAYYTDILAQDSNFFVRTLALCNPVTSSAILQKAAEDAQNDPYTLLVIAHNPNAAPETLNQILTYGGGEEEVRRAVLNNPNCNDILRVKIENWKNQGAES